MPTKVSNGPLLQMQEARASFSSAYVYLRTFMHNESRLNTMRSLTREPSPLKEIIPGKQQGHKFRKTTHN